MKSKRSAIPVKRLVILTIIAALLSAGLIIIFQNADFFPRQATLEMASIYSFIKLLFSIASVFLSIILVVFIDSVVFFRRRKGDDTDGPPIKSNTTLERAWTFIPMFIVVGLAAYGAVVLNDMTKAATLPSTEMEIDVTAYRYVWQFTYPGYNFNSFDLELPVNQRIVFHITSKDVVHSFWVPEFGPKQDAVPGLVTELRITPTELGQYTVY